MNSDSSPRSSIAISMRNEDLETSDYTLSEATKTIPNSGIASGFQFNSMIGDQKIDEAMEDEDDDEDLLARAASSKNNEEAFDIKPTVSIEISVVDSEESPMIKSRGTPAIQNGNPISF